MARDISALQAVLVRALREELAEKEPERFADAVERLADATGAIQAAAVEELVRSRSRELESQANTDPLTGLGNLRNLQTELAQMLEMQKRYGHPFGVLLMDIDGLKRVNDSQGHQAGDRAADAGGDGAAPVDPHASTWRRGSAATSSACSRPSRSPRPRRCSASGSRAAVAEEVVDRGPTRPWACRSASSPARSTARTPRR